MARSRLTRTKAQQVLLDLVDAVSQETGQLHSIEEVQDWLTRTLARRTETVIESRLKKHSIADVIKLLETADEAIRAIAIERKNAKDDSGVH